MFLASAISGVTGSWQEIVDSSLFLESVGFGGLVEQEIFVACSVEDWSFPVNSGLGLRLMDGSATRLPLVSSRYTKSGST